MHVNVICLKQYNVARCVHFTNFDFKYANITVECVHDIYNTCIILYIIYNV